MLDFFSMSNQSESDKSQPETQANQQPSSPQPPANKTPPAKPGQTKHMMFDGAEYIDKNDRAEF